MQTWAGNWNNSQRPRKELTPACGLSGSPKRETAVVFSLLAAEQNVQFLQAAAAHDWYPICFLLGELVGRQLFDAPRDLTAASFCHLAACHRSYRRHSRLQQACRQIQVADGPFGGGVRIVGRDESPGSSLAAGRRGLSRERLIEQLETFHEYRTGFAPPLTFGPNRRVGASGAYVVTIDLINKKLVPVSDWVEGIATSQSDL